METSVHAVLGYIHNFRGEHDSAIAELQTAIELNPSNARAYSTLGMVLVFAGKAEAAIPQLERALRLSPQDPVLWTFMGLRSLALVHLKRYEEAVEWARRAVRQPNVAYLPYSHLASALGQLGRAEDARAALDDAVRLKPDFSLALVERTTRYRHPADREHYLEGLRKAGLSE